MIALVLVVGIAVALCVAGWVPLVRAAVRSDVVAPAPVRVIDDPMSEPVSA